jgi:ABC-type phosphate transport system substrate-binding protein
MPTARLGSISALALMLVVFASVVSADEPPYKIVVHPSNPAVELDRSFLENVFLKKIKTWPSGDSIRPVDQPLRSPIRRAFTARVLRRDLSGVRAYWQQLIFSGREVPPLELDTDKAIVRYVSKHPGAVGYVSTTAPVDRLKVVTTP